MPSSSHLTCHYCNLTHKKVEAGGIRHCPNVLCRGPGAGYWRSKLKSYKDHGQYYSVYPSEAYERGMEVAAALDESEPEIAEAIRRSSVRWLQEANKMALTKEMWRSDAAGR